jgi:murein DD-endopeptidase MepM/ murein hydrolase activator NlpD
LLNFSARPVRVEVDSQNKLLSLKLLWTSDRNQFTTLEIERRAEAADTDSSNSLNLLNVSNTSNETRGSNTSQPRGVTSARARTHTNSGKLFVLKQSTSPLHSSVRYASAVIQTSLFAASDAAQIPDSVAAQLAEVFASDIDFHRTLQKGDHFSLLYEALDADGEFMGYGKLLGAEFVSAGVAHHAIFFKERGTKVGSYFNLKGQSLRRPYLAAPLRFSRITSGYKMRFHPILQTWKAHKGIDYAAPTGTPVHTVGKGVIRTAGFLNGLGNVVFVDHGNAQTTVYAHLSAIKVKVGQSVEQGELIGLVGETGWATGPHLHFEFRIHDQYRDPSTIARQSTTIQLSARAKTEFDQQATSFLVQLGRNSGTNDAVALAQ